MLRQVDRDLERTFPELNFFAKASNLVAMRRILVTFARLNRGLGYIQGMHELLAPLWYVFATDADRCVREAAVAAAPDGAFVVDAAAAAAARADAEADAFRCLSALMCAPFLGGEFRDLFMASSDDTGIGITAVLSRLSAMLRRREPALAAHLEDRLQLSPYLYGFRWVSTLLVREFPLPDVILAWDGLLSDPARFAFLLHMCVAMLRSQRAALLRADLGAAMRRLRGDFEFPPHCADMRALRAAALAVRAEEATEEAKAAAAAAALSPTSLSSSGSFASLVHLFRAPSLSSDSTGSGGLGGGSSASPRLTGAGDRLSLRRLPSLSNWLAPAASGGGRSPVARGGVKP